MGKIADSLSMHLKGFHSRLIRPDLDALTLILIYTEF